MVKDVGAIVSPRYIFFFFTTHITLTTEITTRSTSLKFSLHSEQTCHKHTEEAILLEVKCIFHSGLCAGSHLTYLKFLPIN